MRSRGWESGQGSVEFVALLPLIAIVAAVAWQAAVAGQTVWLAAAAARAAARAHAIGSDASAAARGALPQRLARHAHVRVLPDGSVAVGIAVPAVAGGASLATVTARARFAPQVP